MCLLVKIEAESLEVEGVEAEIATLERRARSTACG
jgi:hypothetical protein